MKKKWKVGLLGAGYIFDAHAKALASIDGVELYAVCDLSKERAMLAAETYGIQKIFTSLDEMLFSDVEVIHILLPPDQHIKAARQVIESSRHVFIEKPMGLSATECREIVDLAKKYNVKLAVNHNFLFLPAYERLRHDAKIGFLGSMDQITINWLYPLNLIQFGPFNNWILRQPKNLFFELGPHLVAFMLDLAGDPDAFNVDTSKPIDLPGGGRVYRRWSVHARSKDISVDLNLSVLPGFTDRSISVRAHAANARCDFDRSLYYRDEPSGHGLLFDNFITALSIAKQLFVGSFVNLVNSVKSTLSKHPSSNPFGDSIFRSIQAFYKNENLDLDERLEGAFALRVIQACELFTNNLDEVSKFNKSRSWDVLPPLSKPTILILGGSGFIGKKLIEKLLNLGYGLRVVTRSISSAQIELSGLNVELMQGRLNDSDLLDKALDGIQVVYHLAKVSGKKWDDYFQNDVLVTKMIAEKSLEKGIKRFIYTGTIDSYYSANASEVISSDTNLDPHITNRNHYARSKAACESLLLNLHRKHGFPVVIFRPGIVIGKGCPPAHWGVGMFQSETRVQFWGAGTNKLPLVLVDDVADGLALALDVSNIDGQTFLLTDDPLISAREYIDVVSSTCGTKFRASSTSALSHFMTDVFKESAKFLIKHPNRKMPSFRDWDSRSHRAIYDASKTKRMLGWKPSGNRGEIIQRGIVDAVRFFYK